MHLALFPRFCHTFCSEARKPARCQHLPPRRRSKCSSAAQPTPGEPPLYLAHKLLPSRADPVQATRLDARGSSKGKYLRTTRRAVEHTIGHFPHLGMSAVAGVGAKTVGQVDYVSQGLQRRAEQRQPTEPAACGARAYRDELGRFAERADDVV